ncbi:hypothetical protein M8J77_025095 [Diaphorina citri]|nr:hypothetical protein M8J77_025095 [Diaphorina citri]
MKWRAEELKIDKTKGDETKSVDQVFTMSSTQSPTSSDGGISEDWSFEEIAPDSAHLEDTNLNSIEDIQNAIAKYKEMILETEGCSNDRKWVVRNLIELRYKLELLKENENQSIQKQEIEIIRNGHHFVLTKTQLGTSKSQLKRCDMCCGYVTVLGLVMPWYECSDCHYVVHVKCVSATRRTCVFVKAGEQPDYELNICPEITLLEQKYKCFECRAPIIYNNVWANPRLCDYDGRHYCVSCHWQDEAIIPARVVLHWDFTRYPVSRASAQLLRIMQNRPILNITAINPSLFGFIEELALVMKYREDLLLMKQYLITCRVALEMNLLWNALDKRQNLLIYPSDVFSLKDLIEIKSGTVVTFLESVLNTFRQHIKQDCKVCFGRGYLCELCIGKVVIFPFDENVHVCPVCQTVYHKHCWLHKNVCTKCERINKKRAQIESENCDVMDGEERLVEEAIELDEEF